MPSSLVHQTRELHAKPLGMLRRSLVGIATQERPAALAPGKQAWRSPWGARPHPGGCLHHLQRWPPGHQVVRASPLVASGLPWAQPSGPQWCSLGEHPHKHNQRASTGMQCAGPTKHIGSTNACNNKNLHRILPISCCVFHVNLATSANLPIRFSAHKLSNWSIVMTGRV